MRSCGYDVLKGYYLVYFIREKNIFRRDFSDRKKKTGKRDVFVRARLKTRLSKVGCNDNQVHWKTNYKQKQVYMWLV